MALVGLSNTLAIEGERNNILCNCIVPTAASRLTKDIIPDLLYKELSKLKHLHSMGVQFTVDHFHSRTEIDCTGRRLSLP